MYTRIPEAGFIINELLHEEVRKLSCTQSDTDLSHFVIEKFIDSVDPLLWEFIETATQSVRESKKSCFSSSNPSQSVSAIHTKRMWRFCILCLLIYGTNPTQITPMHTILADVVGGSHTLIKTLNCLEVLCSTDAHDLFCSPGCWKATTENCVGWHS